MKKNALALAALVGFAACANPDVSHLTQSFYLKNNVSYARYERDTLDCANKATAAAPNAVQVGWVPYIGIYSVDKNDGLRNANLQICMRDKGYAYTPVPHCSFLIRDEIIATGFGRKESLGQKLKVRSDSCYVNDGGRMLLKA
jgi:hypothetical protein